MNDNTNDKSQIEITSGGDTTVGGDVVGGDKITIVTNLTRIVQGHYGLAWQVVAIVAIVAIAVVAIVGVVALAGYVLQNNQRGDARPEYESIHYAFVIDATARMTARFQGSGSKWEAARSAALRYLDSLPPGANYTLVAIGGNLTGNDTTCLGPDEPMVPLSLGNRDAVADMVDHLQPGSVESVKAALITARNALLDKPKGEKSLYVLVGGPNECNEDAGWDTLVEDIEDVLTGGISIRSEIIVLANEEVSPEIVAALNARLRTVGEVVDAEVVGDAAALFSHVDSNIAEAHERAAQIAPVEFGTERPTLLAAAATTSARRTSVAATAPAATAVAVLVSTPPAGGGEPTSLPPITPTPGLAPFPSPEAALPSATTNPAQPPGAATTLPPTSDAIPTRTPTPTATQTPIPTATETPPPPTSTTPPTSTAPPPPPPPPTATPTPSLPTDTPSPTDFPETLSIIGPGNGQSLNCSQDQLCIISVGVQWVPESQRQGRNLSIWVRPLPDNPNEQYWAQAPPQYNGNGIWQSNEVYIGKIGDPPGTPFRIYALVTIETYGQGEVRQSLPPALMQHDIGVTR
jgi:hypothetical protein